jgi:hypothetical protein
MTHLLVETVALAAKASLKRQLGGKPLPGPSSGADDWSAQGGSIDLEEVVRDCFAAILSNGYAIVPVEPTEEQGDEGCKVGLLEFDHACEVYRAMLSAAPKVMG